MRDHVRIKRDVCGGTGSREADAVGEQIGFATVDATLDKIAVSAGSIREGKAVVDDESILVAVVGDALRIAFEFVVKGNSEQQVVRSL